MDCHILVPSLSDHCLCCLGMISCLTPARKSALVSGDFQCGLMEGAVVLDLSFCSTLRSGFERLCPLNKPLNVFTSLVSSGDVNQFDRTHNKQKRS